MKDQDIKKQDKEKQQLILKKISEILDDLGEANDNLSDFYKSVKRQAL